MFRSHPECDICGKRGFRMTKDELVYCKKHWDYFEDLHIIDEEKQK